MLFLNILPYIIYDVYFKLVHFRLILIENRIYIC
jgi:hypothetical protein